MLPAAATLPGALTGCAAPFRELGPGTTADARALLADSAGAHGAASLAAMSDLAVSYDGRWRALMNRLQPALVDAGHRGSSEERLLLRDGVVAQAHTGPQGRKQVVRRAARGGPGTRSGTGSGAVRVWFDGGEAREGDRPAAAALVADYYSLFLLGPMQVQRWSDRLSALDGAGVERITVGERPHWCDVLRARITPGMGFAEADDLALYVDREERLMRRVRFSLNGLASTRSAVAEVDAWGHATLHGVRWPTCFHERLLRPLPLPVHDWRLTGLDVNRGLSLAEVDGPGFTGRAVTPAAALAADATGA